MYKNVANGVHEAQLCSLRYKGKRRALHDDKLDMVVDQCNESTSLWSSYSLRLVVICWRIPY